MKRSFWCIALLFIVLINITIAPTICVGQNLNCQTIATTDSLLVKGYAPPYLPSIAFANVSIFIHVNRDQNGSGGLSTAEVCSIHYNMSDFPTEN